MRHSVVLCLLLAVAAAFASELENTTAAPAFPWQRPPVQGAAPPGRAGVSASLAGNDLVVIGGCEHDISCVSDVHIYDTNAGVWSTVYSGAQNTDPEKSLLSQIVLPPRGYHSATAVNQPAQAAYLNKPAYKVYVFGGQSSNGFRNDMFTFETATRQWSKPLTPAGAPSERAGHSTVQYKDKLMLFGGNTAAGFANDVWQYDMRLNTWTPLETKGTAPPPSAYHTTTLVGDLLYVYGGRNDRGVLGQDVFVLDLTILSWSKPILQGHTPAPRHGHVASVSGSKIFFFAGCDITRKTCYDDVPVLDTEKLMWVTPMPRPGGPNAVLPFPAEVAAVNAATAGVVAITANQVRLWP